MADDAEAVETDERGAAVLGVVDTLAEAPERFARQHVADARSHRRRQLLVQQPLHRFDEPFADLQRDVPGKTVADNHVGLARIHIAAFDVADKPHRRRLEELVRLARQLVALALFLAHRQQAHARRLAPERDTRVRRPHDGELDEVLRPALDGCPRVEQHRRMPPGRDDRGERRPVDARQPAERRVRGHHSRAGVTGAEERGRLSVPHRLGRDPNRGLRLLSQRGRRRLGHLDPIRRIKDTHVDGVGPGMPGERTLHHVARTDEQQADAQAPGGTQRPADDGVGRVVATHGIDCDSEHSAREQRGSLSAVELTARMTYASSTGLTWRPW